MAKKKLSKQARFERRQKAAGKKRKLFWAADQHQRQLEVLAEEHGSEQAGLSWLLEQHAAYQQMLTAA